MPFSAEGKNGTAEGQLQLVSGAISGLESSGFQRSISLASGSKIQYSAEPDFWQRTRLRFRSLNAMAGESTSTTSSGIPKAALVVARFEVAAMEQVRAS